MYTRRLLSASVRVFYYFVELTDALLVVLAGLLAVNVVQLLYGNVVFFPLSDPYLIAMAFAALLLVTLLRWGGAYTSWRGRSLWGELGLMLPNITLMFLLLAGLAFASKTGAQVSRLWFLTWAALTFFLFIIERLSLRSLLKFLRANGWDTKRIVLIGEGSVAARAYQTVLKSPQAGLNFLGYFRVSQEQDELRGLLPHLGGRDDLGQIVDLRPDQTWIALPNGSQDEILEVLYRLRHATSDLLVIPAIDEYLLSRQVIEIAGVPVVQVGSVAPGGIAWMLKGLTDRVAAFILLVFFSPLFCMIAVAVLLSSPGPVLFRQARHGLGGKEFNIYKFRTMYVAKETADGYQQASQVDPRITPLGSFLRRTSLDEIPQVFNVLLGSMSMVGPRPHPVQMNRIYQEKIERYMWRHKIKPGITGWAQINGMRGETDTLDKLQKRVEYDLYYIKHWSYWLDIKILWLTLFRVFRDPMAY